MVCAGAVEVLVPFSTTGAVGLSVPFAGSGAIGGVLSCAFEFKKFEKLFETSENELLMYLPIGKDLTLVS